MMTRGNQDERSSIDDDPVSQRDQAVCLSGARAGGANGRRADGGRLGGATVRASESQERSVGGK